ncbi:MAG: thioesterase family protein [Halieaceae bacterium]
MSVFERATAVTKIADQLWQAELVHGWRIGEVPNGGYVLAIAGRVLSEALSHSDPLTVNILYTAPTALGPIECELETLRVGGSTTHATLSMRQEGELKAFVTACYTDMDKLKGESWCSVERPAIASIEDIPATGVHGIELRESVDQHYASGGEVFKRGEPDGSGCFSGWLRLHDGADTDVIALLLFADCMAPPVFTVYGALQWVPTMDLSVQVRARPAPGPVQVRFRSRYMSHGIVEEDGELWDSNGELVALSRQTSKVRVRAR